MTIVRPATRFTKGRKGHKVEAIVLHYTGGGSGYALARWFASNDPRMQVSAHFIISRDGRLIPCVDLDDTAWHAGTRKGRGDMWRGQEDPEVNANYLTIGIELANYGKLQLVDSIGKQEFLTPYGKKYRGPKPVNNGSHWEPYTEKQLATLDDLLIHLIDEFGLDHATCMMRHSEISPRRKKDPGPAFPWEKMQDTLATHFNAETHYDEEEEMCMLSESRGEDLSE